MTRPPMLCVAVRATRFGVAGAFAAFAVFGAAGSVRVAHADAGNAATAEAMFLDGRHAMEAGDYAHACPKFAESQRLDPAAGTLMNLAACEEKLAKLASAWQHWKEAIDALPPKDDRIAFAHSRVVDLERRLSWLTVNLAPGTDASARVLRDDVELGRASQGVPLPVDAGEHTVTVLVPGRAPDRLTVSLLEAEAKTIEVREGAAVPREPVEDRASNLRTIGWITLGLGAVGAATATATGIWLVQIKNTVDTNCPDHGCINQKGLDAVTTGKALVIANTAGVVVGAAGLGLGAYLVLSNPNRRAAAALAPSIGPGQLGATCTGTF